METFSLRRAALSFGITALAFGACVLSAGPVRADGPAGFLETVKKHVTLTSTVADNGDQNPYAVVVAPVSAGVIQKDDVLIDNFNDLSNLQGLGTTIVDYNPGDPQDEDVRRFAAAFAKVSRRRRPDNGHDDAPEWLVIVGSTPSDDGTTRTKGDGCLLVLDANGKLVDVWAGSDINGPWGNMAVIDNGTTATLFVSMAGFDVPGPQVRDSVTGYPVTVAKATVLRIDLSIPDGQKPVIKSRTVIANGFGQRADRDAFLIGPTGLALGSDDTLYVSDALANRIVGIPDARTRTTTAGTGREITAGGLLQRPLALIMAPNGHLLVVNGRNGQVVEVDPVAGKQIYAQWIDANQAQSPPGNGDLFGLAIKPDGKGFYYVQDEMNTILEAR